MERTKSLVKAGLTVGGGILRHRDVNEDHDRVDEKSIIRVRARVCF